MEIAQVMITAVHFSRKKVTSRDHCSNQSFFYIWSIFQRPLLPLNVYLIPVMEELLHCSHKFVSFSLAEEINYEVRFKDKTWSSDLTNPDSLLYRKFEDEIQEMVIINVAVCLFLPISG